MHQTFFKRKRSDEFSQLRMSQGLVNVVEPDVLGRVISINRLQTEDVTQEGRSGQAAENKNRVMPLQASQLKGLTLTIKSFDVR